MRGNIRSKWWQSAFIRNTRSYHVKEMSYSDMVKQELRAENLKARVENQKCEFKSTSYEFESTNR